jgi:U3 small nucleolar RNA-associated protein 7
MDFLNKKIENKIKETIRLNKNLSYKAKIANKYLDQEQEGYIIPEEGEETNKMSQKYISNYLPSYNIQHLYSLTLPNGPFKIDFSSNSNSLLLCSRLSSSIIDWKKKDLKCQNEYDKHENIFDCKFINGDRLFALSQKERLFIYDNQGIEIHSLDTFPSPRYLENLPYHFLLVVSMKNK